MTRIKIYSFWGGWVLHRVFIAVLWLSLVSVSRGYCSLRGAGFSLWWLVSLESPGLWDTQASVCSHQAQSLAGLHLPSCSEACGIFPDQESNSCPLHWDHQNLVTVSSAGSKFCEARTVCLLLHCQNVRRPCEHLELVFQVPRALSDAILE